MIFRRFTCPNCGAVSEDAAEEIYVWCQHCASYIDYDAQAFFRQCRDQEYKAYYGKVAQNYQQKETLKAEGNRESLLRLEREEAEIFFESLPLFLPPRARKPGPIQDKYIEYYAQCNTERQLNPEIRKMNEECVSRQAQYYTHTPGGPLGFKTTISAEGLIKIIENNLAVAEESQKILEALGIEALNPCPYPPGMWQKPFISALFQGYSQFLEKESFETVLKHFHLQRSFEWKAEPGTNVCCGICGSPLPHAKKGSVVACDTCGTSMEKGSVGFSCGGCGAPLALPHDADFIQCPYCSTVTNDATFQPLKTYEAWWKEVRALNPDRTWKYEDDTE